MKKFSFTWVYFRLCSCCNHEHLAFDTGVGHCMYRCSTALCYHENCLLVFITSCVWDVTILRCFCGVIGGSTLITLAIPCINWATKVTKYAWIWASQLLVALCASTLGIKTLSQAYALVRINLRAVGWLSSFFHSLGWRITSGPIGNLFCGLQYSAGLLCFVSLPSLA